MQIYYCTLAKHYNGVATVVSLLLFVKWHIVCTLLHVCMTLYGNFLGVQLFEQAGVARYYS